MEDIRILIAEDNSILREDLIERIAHFGYSNIIGPFSSGEEALLASKEESPHIALLDISLSGNMSGIDLAKELNKKAHVPIVFLTIHDDERTYEKVKTVKPAAFINKPWNNIEIRSGIDRAIDALDAEHKPIKEHDEDVEVLSDRVFVRNRRGKVALPISDILWIKSGGGENSVIVTKTIRDSEKQAYYTVSCNLQKLEEKLALCTELMRVSRYYIANITHTTRLLDATLNSGGDKKMLLIDGEEIPIGEKYRKEVMKRFMVI